MKTKLKIYLLLMALLSLPGFAHAQGTAISYQGRLNDGSAPATGLYDFTFSVYEAEIGGVTETVVAGPLARDAVPVTNGLFNVALDFGPAVFTGPARWLQISVRANGVGDLTPLTPRTPLLPTPYSIFAATAGSVPSGTVVADQLNTGGVLPTQGQFLSYDGGNLFWSDPGPAVGDVWSRNLPGTDIYYTAGNVGIGTATPTPGVRLEVNGSTRVTAGGSGGFLQIGTPNGESGLGVVGANRFDLRFDGATLKLAAGVGTGPPPPQYGITINTNGNVGIGMASPLIASQWKLEVNGATRLTPGGSGGAVYISAPNGESGLGIIGANRADLRFDGSTLKLVAGAGVGPPPSGNGVAITTAGNVGIGTTSPGAKLVVTTATVDGGLFATPAIRGQHLGDGSGIEGLAISGPGVRGTSISGYGVVASSTSHPAIFAQGNVRQTREKGGFVKAMIFVKGDGTIVRGFNSFLDGDAATTSPCGFTVQKSPGFFGEYVINFGFPIVDRFVNVFAANSTVIGVLYGESPQGLNLNSLWLTTASDTDLTVFVY